MATEIQSKERLFHIAKRDVLPKWKVAIIYVVAVVIALILSSLLSLILFGANPITVIKEIFMGNFGTEQNLWLLLQDMSLLLLVGLALVPSFKMKFWNLGGNGQILMGCLACIACMYYFGGKLPDAVVWLMMLVSSILAGAIWAVIPAIFKSKWNTNESLFTLMMNYISEYIVLFVIGKWVTDGSGTLQAGRHIKDAYLPKVGNSYLLIIIVAVIIVTFMYFYLKKSKHGFEVNLVGESQNTAKYVGINVKKIIIRTLILSGAICGLVGLLLGGAKNHTINNGSAKNMGFTAIMVVWFAKCDPLLMIVSSFGVTFLTKGMDQVKTTFKLTNDALPGAIVGFVFFIIITCDFFINYKITFKKKSDKRLSSDFINSDKTDVKEEK